MKAFFFTHLPIRFPLMAASDSRMAFDSGFALFLPPQRFIQPQGHHHVAIIERMEIKTSYESGY